MATIKTFEELECWKAARELARVVYRITRNGAFAKDYDLKGQMRRAAVSALSNIAEGYERESKIERLRFLNIGKASAGEVRAQLYVALDEGYITTVQFDEVKQIAERTSRLTKGFARYLETLVENAVRANDSATVVRIRKRVTCNV